MLTVEQAVAQLLAAAEPVTGTETIDTLHACGRVLAQPLVAAINVPPLDNSAMDGYAVRRVDVPVAGTRLPVSQRIAAGQVGAILQAGSAARIFTGAPIPQHADAVLMQEDCSVDGDGVVIHQMPKPNQHIRRAGEDIAAGTTILEAGRPLRPQECGLAASVGAAQLTVFARLRVAVLFTGDELTLPGQPLKPGAIYNSNRFVLINALQQLGCVVNDLGIVPDNLAATRAALQQAAQSSDLIISSGGVSVGEEDHVKAAVDAEGAMQLWSIAVKPGKPLAFGHIKHSQGATPIIGLPGNPVSSLVTFLVFARPFILRRQGRADVAPQAMQLRADFNWPRPDKRREFLRVRLNAAGGLDLFPNQKSGVLTSTTWADGLVNNPPGQVINVGDEVEYLQFSGLCF